MTERDITIVVNESYNGEDIIPNLILAARNLVASNPNQSRDFFEKALVLSKGNNFQVWTGECLLELGKIQRNEGNITEACKLLKEASHYLNSTQETESKFEIDTIYSDLSLALGNYDDALESSLKALTNAKQINNFEFICKANIKIGKVYEALGDHESAFQFFDNALQIFTAEENKRGISKCLCLIGNCQLKLNRTEDAFSSLDKSLLIADELNENQLQATPNALLGKLFTKLNQPERAIDYFFRAIDLSNITNNIKLKSEVILNLGKLFCSTQNYERAIQTLSEGIEMTGTGIQKTTLAGLHKTIAQVYELTGEINKALFHYKLFHDFFAEWRNEQITAKTIGLQLKYDVDQIKNEKDLATKAGLIKDQFIANISHEIRTPLNGVLGMADLLSDTNPTHEQHEYINTIKLSANNLIHLVDDILDFSKIESGEIILGKIDFNVKSLVADLISELKAVADDKNLNIAYKIGETVPEIIIGDSIRLKQILQQIISNSIHFTDKGAVKLEIGLTYSHEKTCKLMFTITDTGVGISEEKIGSIFESFGVAKDDNSIISGGAGLGLTIVKRLVDLFGGSISVNSKIASGTTVKVELPFGLTQALKNNNNSNKINNPVNAKDVAGMTILVVEDNKVNQFLAQKLITKMGFTVVIANNGKEAIKFLLEQKFNLILMDVQMPEMNGYELTETIRTTLPDDIKNIPIIALTAYASTQEKERALSLGMSDYITKPYSPHELMTSITKQVSQQIDESKNIIAPGIDSEITKESIMNGSEKLLQLFGGNVNDVLSLLHMLISQIPMLMDESRRYVTTKNWPALFQTMHKLKSSLNLLKINSLTNLVTELEELSRDQIQTEKIEQIFSSLNLMCSTTVDLLKTEIIRLKKTD